MKKWNWFVLLFAAQLSAWSGSGHEVVAQIALNQFSKAEQKQIQEILGNLIELSSEPDEYRGLSSFLSNWHYIDYPLVEEPIDNVIKLVKKKDNVVWALNEAKRVLGQKTKSKHTGLLHTFKSNFIHLIGDVHQPLHCISRVTQKNPNGDRGGNLVFVYFKSKKIKLHLLWDIGFGMIDSLSSEQVVELAKKIEKEYPASSLTLSGSYKDWSKESYALAKDHAYRVVENQPVSPEYVIQSEKIIRQRLAQAGYRLAQEIRKLYF